MTQTVKQFKEDIKVYDAFEKSSLGQLVKEGYMNIAVNTSCEEIIAGYHPSIAEKDHFAIRDYGDINTVIDSILQEVGVSFSLTEVTSEPITIDEHKYAYLIYNKDVDGIRTLLFGTVYNLHEIFDIRQRFSN